MNSERKSSVICFCCRLFYKKHKSTQFSEDGVSDWKNFSVTHRHPEKSAKHMKKWFTLTQRLQTQTTRLIKIYLLQK